jgi:ATP-dependent DNA ligase
MFYAFDALIHRGKDLMKLDRSHRRKIMAEMFKPDDYVGISEVSESTLTRR